METAQSDRAAAIRGAFAIFDDGQLLHALDARVGCKSESQNPTRGSELQSYLSQHIGSALERLGFSSRLVPNPVAEAAPFLIAERLEDPEYLTVLTYGHGDVSWGNEGQWREGLDPWRVVVDGDRWYGRGTADNKGQHSINFAALDAVLALRGGKLGYNIKLIFETGEEIGSPGLAELCELERQALAADLFLASDGPRAAADRPTVFLGSRGYVSFELLLDLRAGAHHSGNWGGVLANPAVLLSHAIVSLIGEDGRILVEGLRPPPIDPVVRTALSDIALGRDEKSPDIDPDWGEPGLTPTERVIAWNTLEVLAIKAGNADSAANAIPPSAKAVCQLRFVVGTDWTQACAHVERHLADHGFTRVRVKWLSGSPATRLELDNPWVKWVLDSIQASSGKTPALLPNMGGTIPNHVFAQTLGLPTLWVPHSYPGCNQHAPNEHLLAPVAREALGIMAGIWWDLGDAVPGKRRAGA